MERYIRRALCLLMGSLVVAGLVFILALVTGAVGGAPAIEVLWRLSGLGAACVGSFVGAVGIGLLRDHPLGGRILEWMVLLLAVALVGSFVAATQGLVSLWGTLGVGVALIVLWGLWLASQLVDLDRWRRR